MSYLASLVRPAERSAMGGSALVVPPAPAAESFQELHVHADAPSLQAAQVAAATPPDGRVTPADTAQADREPHRPPTVEAPGEAPAARPRAAGASAPTAQVPGAVAGRSLRVETAVSEPARSTFEPASRGESSDSQSPPLVGEPGHERDALAPERPPPHERAAAEPADAWLSRPAASRSMAATHDRTAGVSVPAARDAGAAPASRPRPVQVRIGTIALTVNAGGAPAPRPAAPPAPATPAATMPAAREGFGFSPSRYYLRWS
jgi:hypothetical protein